MGGQQKRKPALTPAAAAVPEAVQPPPSGVSIPVVGVLVVASLAIGVAIGMSSIPTDGDSSVDVYAAHSEGGFIGLQVPNDTTASSTDSHYAPTYLNRGEALVAFAKSKKKAMTGCGQADCDPLGITESALHHTPRQVVQNMYAAVQLAEGTEGKPSVWAKACSLSLQIGHTVWSHSLAFCSGAMAYNGGRTSDKIRKSLANEAQRVDDRITSQERTDTKRLLRNKTPSVPELTRISSGEVVHLSPTSVEQHQLFSTVINTVKPDADMLHLADELNSMAVARWNQHKKEYARSASHKNAALDAGRMNNDFFAKTGHDGARREHWPELQNSKQFKKLKSIALEHCKTFLQSRCVPRTHTHTHTHTHMPSWYECRMLVPRYICSTMYVFMHLMYVINT